MSFTANGDPALPDASPGSGVEPLSLTAPETFETSGTFLASGTVADYAGNVSSAGTLHGESGRHPAETRNRLPEPVLVGEAGVHATVTASDGESGLASDPSEVVPIDTTQTGPQTVTRTAIDNVGHETTKLLHHPGGLPHSRCAQIDRRSKPQRQRAVHARLDRG